MSWQLHVSVYFAVLSALFLSGVWYGLRVVDANPIATFLAAAAVALGARFAFRALVLARCPACEQVTARQVGSRPLAYECGACGHRHETALSEGHRHH